ncbi:MAG: DUF4177 domain-containing protein [Oscillospiraceae bacterium]|nr:DUF4177 domain-containing protein [Oscillospiraceae bacterium]
MQYKTVTVEHPKGLVKMAVQKVNDEYQQILNEQAVQGWKLLGIHTIDIRRRVGCLGRLWRIFWAILGDSESEDFFQADVLVFFKEDRAVPSSEYPAAPPQNIYDASQSYMPPNQM